MRFTCPLSTKSKEDRIKDIFSQINQWIQSRPFKEMVDLFSTTDIICGEENLTVRLNKLADFSNVWDYRKIQQHKVTTQQNEAARWLLHDDKFVSKHSAIILNAANELGLVNVVNPLYDQYDYILILGGARFSNLHRCEMAAKVIRDNGIKNCKVISLGAMRPISDTERTATDTYAPGAETEFDTLHAGMKKTFYQGKDIKFFDEKYADRNSNLSWCIREYQCSDDDNVYYLVAAPSSDYSRRANSADAYEFFFERFQPECGSRILLCTSSIYIPYQHIRFFEYDINYNVVSDMVGVDSSITQDISLSKPVNYLQELRSAILAMESFVNNFQKFI